MSYAEILSEAEKLSVNEQLALIKAITELVQARLDKTEKGKASILDLYGILATDKPAPTDEEVKEMITEYLTEKYK